MPPSDAEEQDAAGASRQVEQPEDELFARDPVCGTALKKTETPYFALPQGPSGHVAYFDREECKRRFEQDPARYAANT